MKSLIVIGAVLFAMFLTGHPVSAEEKPIFSLTIKDHKFEPATLELPADTKIELRVKNVDATPEEFESIELHREKIIPGGEEATLYVGPLKPGTYGFFGEFNPDTAQGKIIVK